MSFTYVVNITTDTLTATTLVAEANIPLTSAMNTLAAKNWIRSVTNYPRPPMLLSWLTTKEPARSSATGD